MLFFDDPNDLVMQQAERSSEDLLYDFVERYHAQGATRFMLWCTIDNVAAVKMYETTGFKTIGRNCISMIRKKK